MADMTINHNYFCPQQVGSLLLQLLTVVSTVNPDPASSITMAHCTSNNLTGVTHYPGKLTTVRIPPYYPTPTSLPFGAQLPALAPAAVPKLAVNTPENGIHANDGTINTSVCDSLKGEDDFFCKKKERLYSGNVLSVYSRAGTAGKPADHRTAEVTGVFATNDLHYNKELPIIINTDEYIGREWMVKKILCLSGN